MKLAISNKLKTRFARLIETLAVILAVLCVIQIVNTAVAQTPVSDTATKDTPGAVTPTTPLQYQPWHLTAKAQDWGLDDDAWARYQDLMRGEAGLHYAHMEPIFVLGMYAQSDAEKRMYAERYVQMDAARLDRLMAFNRAHADARAKLYPAAKRIDKAQLAKRRATLDSPLYSLKKPRLQIYLHHDCPSCDQLVSSLVQKDREMDLFFVGQINEAGIQSWARNLNLPISKVESNRITLNFDDGWFDTYGSGEFPAIYERGDSGFTPVALEQLN